MNTPYTHPSMPGTPAMFDLSAALEDAEGHALVEDIIERKRTRNHWDRYFQMAVWGEVLTDGHGNVIPREEPDYWSAFDALTIGQYWKALARQEREKRERLWNIIDDGLSRSVDAPPISVDNVRWPSDNRKLNPRYADKASALHDILGVGEYGSDD